MSDTIKMVTKKDLEGALSAIAIATGMANEGATERGLAYKQAKAAGFHKGVLKIIYMLNKMDDAARSAWLEAFDRDREFANLDRAPPLEMTVVKVA